jgi:hypothetical protein
MRNKLVIMMCIMTIAATFTIAPNVSKVNASSETYLKIVSDVTELGPENVEGQNFTVRCIIENVTNLYGVDIQIGWTTEYIRYVNHTKMIPVETHPGGILYSSTVPVKDDVDENASMPGAAPGTMYWVAEASMAPAASFNGTGTAFEMTFQVKKQPIFFDSHIYINITSSTLSDKSGSPIDHTQVNLHILLHGRPQPAGPTINISSINYKGSVPYTFDVNVSILNLDPYWDLGGFDIKVSYDPQVLEATSIIADPDGWFANFWSNTLIIKNETNNDIGRAWAAVLGLPYENGTHTEPYGNATLCTISFKAYASGPIEKLSDAYSLAAYPHPERPEPPFNNAEWSVPIPFNVTQGFANVIGVMEHTPLTGYIVTTESNSSVSPIFFKLGIPTLIFNVTGVEGYTGYCNITIPKSFMWSTVEDGWIVLVDGQMVTPTITEDAENTYVYFTYSHSTHNISIITTSVVPEFNFAMMLTTLLTAAIALGLIKKKK